MKLTKYEIEILRILLKSDFNDTEIDNLILTSTITGYDFTGVGYFLEISSDLLPKERKVISGPIIIGKANGIEVSFVLFLEKNTLCIECFSFGEKNLPKNIRARKLDLIIANEL